MTSNSSPPPIPFETTEAFLQDGMELFKDLMRIDTTNPPGNEKEAVDYAARGTRNSVRALLPRADATP